MTITADPGSEGRTGQGDATLAVVEREEFWADSCREPTQMQHPSQVAMRIYRKPGCRFCSPGKQQIQYVLNALDAAAPGWEKEHPELFYQTLELNYPELVRRA